MGVAGSIFCESIKVHLYLGPVKSKGLVFGLFIFGPFLFLNWVLLVPSFTSEWCKHCKTLGTPL